MSSLYKRATPAQARVLRIVEGAIKNAAGAHPEIIVSARHRRSIAKRAAGTLTAQWPEVLAANASERGSSSEGAASQLSGAGAGRGGHNYPRRGAAGQINTGGGAGEKAAPDGRLRLLGRIEPMLWQVATPLRCSGDAELYDAIIRVIQIMGSRRKSVTGSGRAAA